MSWIVFICNTIWLNCREHSGYGFSQWQTTLHYDIISHCLSTYPEWSLRLDWVCLAILPEKYAMSQLSYIQACWVSMKFLFGNMLTSSSGTITVKCHYNACHYNANGSLTQSILGSQTVPTWPFPSSSAHGLNVWNHRGLIGHSSNDTSLFPFKWNKTKVSHLLVMSIQSIYDWSLIKHTDYSSPVLRECHHQANMAARCPDVENNPGSNQVNISHMQVN